MQVRIAQVLVGSCIASAVYEDTGQPVRANKTAWRVTLVDDYGCEEVFYFQSEEAAREFAQEIGRKMWMRSERDAERKVIQNLGAILLAVRAI